MTVRRRALGRQSLTDREIAELIFGLAPGFPSAFAYPDDRVAAQRTLERLQREEWDALERWMWSYDNRLPDSGGTGRTAPWWKGSSDG
ncbi:MAG: hypothetical protein M3Q66_02425 [Chloroflexota bacterium]|nr:hypothetical protein [Chloroflexota bacterium]